MLQKKAHPKDVLSHKNEVKHLKTISDKSGKTYLLAAINNEKPKLFLINE